MMGGRIYPGILGTCATLLVLVQAGPLLRFPRESDDYPSDFSNYTANEVCFSDEKVFQRGEEVPNAGPCEECRCEPPSIVCQMIKCPVNNNGCRTIQRPNHCCPDYNCECDYNGQLYNDGERIDLPEDPCQVCYCKGGDVMCTSITCYQRDDCEPKHVPGQCCPKYEDCPIRDMEASNTEDKNVQTRSPNKTMNNNPKNEMQPWLLTKSVPHKTSSLAIPSPGETTTDSGNVVIVSDWLVERKTTEDFNTNQTDNPDFSTHREFITTTKPQKPTQYIEKEITFEKNIQTAKPTPVDEVVFTRIDIPKIIQEEIHDSLTTTASTTAKNSNSTVFKIPETLKDLNILIRNTTSNSSIKYSEEKLIATKKTDKVNSSSSAFYRDSGNEIMTTTSSTELTEEDLSIQTSTITNKIPITVEPSKDNGFVETSTPEVEITENSLNATKSKTSELINESTQNKTVETDSVPKLVDDFDEQTNISQGIAFSDNKDKLLKETTLENLFGLDKFEEDEGIKQISTTTEKYSTGDFITFLDKQKTTEFTTLPAKIENLFAVEDSKDDSLTNNPTTTEINHAENSSSTKRENSSYLFVPLTTTETSHSFEEKENITYFVTELKMNKLPLQSGNFVNERNEKGEETTYLPDTTTGIETSTLFLVTTGIPNQLNDEEKGNKALENLIEGKEKENTDNSNNIDTTTPSNTENSSGYTDQVTSDSNKSSNVQRIHLNTKNMLNEGSYKNNTPEESFHNDVSSAITDSTSTPNNKETTNSLMSEIEIILGETNNTTELDKSISSQKSKEQGEMVLDLAFDNISDENKETINVNHPPVLELNSHVPFLQIGGDGNSESSHTEYDKTTVVDHLDVLDERRKNTTNGNKEIVRVVQSEGALNSTATVTPSTALEMLSSTKKTKNEKVEEFTIPTIAVVPLTPGDLKMIAEYLISEKIKPASSKNNSMHSANQWLKGNLTSDENIASILSAANISIGLMNNTYIGRKLETFNKSNQSVLFEKFEKETRYKSNSIIENNNIVTSKTDYLHDKNSDSQEAFKTPIHSQEEIDNGRIASEHFSTEASSDSTTTMTLKPTNNRSKQDLNTDETFSKTIDREREHKNKSDTSLKSEDHFSIMATAGSNKTDHEIIKQQTTKTFNDKKPNKTKTVNKNLENVNAHETVSLGTKEENTNQGTTQIISRFSVSERKPFDSYTSSKPRINKSSHEEISS